MPLLNRLSADTTRGLYLVYVLYTDRNDVRYVGMTKRGLYQRLKEHKGSARAGERRPLYDWMRSLHTLDDVHIEVIAEASSVEDLCELEAVFIQTMRLADFRLLNVADGGLGSTGFRHTTESKQKISASTLGRPKTAETRLRMSEARKGEGATWFGKTFSDEHRGRISDSIRGVNNPFFGRTHSDETRQRISATKRSKPSPANHVKWHVMRNMTSPTCSWCEEGAAS